MGKCVWIFREADEDRIQHARILLGQMLLGKKMGREPSQPEKECQAVMRIWLPVKERGRDPWEGASQTALSSRKIQQGDWQFWSQSQLSPCSLVRQAPQGGVAPAQAQQGYLQPLISCAVCSWKSGRPILETTRKISDNKHRLAATIFQSRANRVGIPLPSNIQLAFSKSSG